MLKQFLGLSSAAAIIAAGAMYAQSVPSETTARPVISKVAWGEVSEVVAKQGLATSEEFQRRVELQQRRDKAAPPDKDPRGERMKPEYAFTARFDDFRRRAEDAEVPVLLPQSAVQAEAAGLAIGDGYYDFTAIYPGNRILAIMGTCAAISLPEGHPIYKYIDGDAPQNRLARLNAPYSVSGGEAGSELTFTKFNCSYKITLSCQTHACGTDDQLINIAEDLGVINAR